jgi:hypothetical protein
MPTATTTKQNVNLAVYCVYSRVKITYFPTFALLRYVPQTALIGHLRFQIIELAIRKRNSLATMASVSQLCGGVILTTIAVMTVMNPPTSAETITAQRVGEDVLVMPIIDAFRNGCFAMAKMIAEMVPMNSTKIAHLARRKEISDAETEDVFQSKKKALFNYIPASQQSWDVVLRLTFFPNTLPSRPLPVFKLRGFF